MHLLPGEEAAKAGAEGTGADSDGSEQEGPSVTKAAKAESRKTR